MRFAPDAPRATGYTIYWQGQVRRQLAVVGHEPVLYNASIMENVK